MPIKQRHREQAVRVTLSVLGVIAAASIISAVAIAPGVAAVLKSFEKLFPSRQRYEIDRVLRRLIRRGFVEEVMRGRVVHYQLTDRGREHLMRREFTNTEFEKQKKWDGKWRIVVFDIPEKRRHLRDTLREHLNHLGLYPIQKSVWLYPYPCDDLVRLMKVDLNLGRNVQYFTVGKFSDREEEKDWRIRFDV
ncbi:hypothetical protein HY634_01290 [Candidatus Uhrbacteria bacterium]|nr:hypothetical protein [Candidatus Uhrbacteria bacterium]